MEAASVSELLAARSLQMREGMMCAALSADGLLPQMERLELMLRGALLEQFRLVARQEDV